MNHAYITRISAVDILNIMIRRKFAAAGGNRHPNAADWYDDILAFGSGKNIAIWNPISPSNQGIEHLLRGHDAEVNALRICQFNHSDNPYVISGSADGVIRLWERRSSDCYVSKEVGKHDASINTVAVLPEANLVVTGSADGIVKTWHVSPTDNHSDSSISLAFTIHQTIVLKPRLIPLVSAVTRSGNSNVLAIGGTSTLIHVYHQSGNSEFELAAKISGHEGWIRSLDFTHEDRSDSDSDIILASASQDKYIRLWRLRAGNAPKSKPSASSNVESNSLNNAFTTTTYTFGAEGSLQSIAFEALLVGHEDWIFTARWNSPNNNQPLRLMSVSADNSISIWSSEFESGIWTCQTRLGEISAQKGSTTATGSTGGFWIGLWAPSSTSKPVIACLGRTGSWRTWSYDAEQDEWVQTSLAGVSGHVKEVKSLAWSPDASYLLTTGSDQTTRLFAPWKHDDGHESWHEMARPQIHGYDLNCIDTITSSRFVSGADEKLLRVFDKPRSTATTLARLSGKDDSSVDMSLPETAIMPVLGLSNKTTASGDVDDAIEGLTQLNIDNHIHPPLEDTLSRHTLWPEHEKLYGHGYEISCLATSPDSKLIATACRASSYDHAVIRLYETDSWREIKPSLSNHTLTITALAWAPPHPNSSVVDDKLLLSVGRDRMWTIFIQDKSTSSWSILTSDPKGHSRMILDCSWAPYLHNHNQDSNNNITRLFATAGRDKLVKLWTITFDKHLHRRESVDAKGVDCNSVMTVPFSKPVTSVEFCSSYEGESNIVLLACGTEDGEVKIVFIDTRTWTLVSEESLVDNDRPAGAISSMKWRPKSLDHTTTSTIQTLAIGSEDHSVRLFDIDSTLRTPI